MTWDSIAPLELAPASPPDISPKHPCALCGRMTRWAPHLCPVTDERVQLCYAHQRDCTTCAEVSA